MKLIKLFVLMAFVALMSACGGGGEIGRAHV